MGMLLLMLQLPSRMLLGLLQREVPARVAALGMCATKTLGRGADPGPGAQEKLHKGEQSPFLSCRDWIRAALWGTPDQGRYHCTLSLISQLKLPARTKRILGVEITGVGRGLLEWAV